MTTTDETAAAFAHVADHLEEIDERLARIEATLAAFTALLEKYTPALEVLDQRLNRATRWGRK